MIRYYCDHCGQEIECAGNELDYEDCFCDGERFVGEGCIMCDSCFDLRNRLHIDLDKEFFHLKENKKKTKETIDK